MNPYTDYVINFARLVEHGRGLPLGAIDAAARPTFSGTGPSVLFFAPHPDDETIQGGLALRLLREQKMRVLDVAVTQGSKKERQAPRLLELQQACDFLGFGVVSISPNGLERINPGTRQSDHGYWTACVDVIHRILDQYRPRIIFFPHDRDWNSTHIGTHYLVMDALKRMPADFECFAIETEFWGQMDDPNLMIEISPADVADLIAATSFHVGEVRRNPYHLLLPAWMLDNTRRGAELVGGQGGVAPNFTFSLLHRLRVWRGGQLQRFFDGGKQVSQQFDLNLLFS